MTFKVGDTVRLKGGSVEYAVKALDVDGKAVFAGGNWFLAKRLDMVRPVAPAKSDAEHFADIAKLADHISPPAGDAMTLTADSKTRKATPIATGVLDYFPLALAAISRLSKAGNDKHNPGQPMHWARGKSTDHVDCVVRHLIDRGKIDPDSGELHDVGMAWRALANLELAEEKRLGISK